MNQTSLTSVSLLLALASFSSAVVIDNQLNDEVKIETITVRLDYRYSPVYTYTVPSKFMAYKHLDQKETFLDEAESAVIIANVTSKTYGVCSIQTKGNMIALSDMDQYEIVTIQKSANGGCEVFVDY